MDKYTVLFGFDNFLLFILIIYKQIDEMRFQFHWCFVRRVGASFMRCSRQYSNRKCLRILSTTIQSITWKLFDRLFHLYFLVDAIVKELFLEILRMQSEIWIAFNMLISISGNIFQFDSSAVTCFHKKADIQQFSLLARTDTNNFRWVLQ